MNHIILDVYCMGCGEPIPTPADGDMDFFRLGLPVHTLDSCYEALEQRLRSKEPVRRRGEEEWPIL